MDNTEKTDVIETPAVNDTITAEIGATTIGPATGETIVASAVTHEHKKEQKQTAPLSHKEMKALHKARYEDIMENPRFKNAYLLKNVKTNQMVEIRASSSFHACNIIGWKHNKVRVLNVRAVEDVKAVPETINSSNNSSTAT